MTIGETAASTGGTGTQNILQVGTLATSTANPLSVVAHGTSALMVNNAGYVGIGTTAPTTALQVSGTTTTTAATVTGNLTTTQVTETAVNLGGALSGTVTINLANGTYFYGTVSGTTTFAVSNNAASGSVSSFTLELTNGGSQALTWMSGTKWPGGVAPTLTSAGVDLLVCSTRDGATTWRCVASEVNSE